ncbi:MAG: hypothetical protein GXY52_01400 [Chloroflexi bacterium]|nr:hypothetical protein [Chloroflexota bacterium]
MATIVEIDGIKFLINGRPTYEGITWRGHPMDGLLLSSRMVQAIYDDTNPGTRTSWAYPDSGQWDPERNTDDFCAALPLYCRHGLLAVTVGLQGGAVFTDRVYKNYVNSAFTPQGELVDAYQRRMQRVLAAANAAGMVVIVNYFYWRQAARMEGNRAIERATLNATQWLLDTGYRNILLDIVNDANTWPEGPTLLQPNNVHHLIEVANSVTSRGRRLLASVSTIGGPTLPTPAWQAAEDFHLPHGNGLDATQLAQKLHALKHTDIYRRHPKPIVVNEDSIFINNLEAAVVEGCSWGFYCQGYGSHYRDRMDWTTHAREDTYEALSALPDGARQPGALILKTSVPFLTSRRNDRLTRRCLADAVLKTPA